MNTSISFSIFTSTTATDDERADLIFENPVSIHVSPFINKNSSFKFSCLIAFKIDPPVPSDLSSMTILISNLLSTPHYSL